MKENPTVPPMSWISSRPIPLLLWGKRDNHTGFHFWADTEKLLRAEFKDRSVPLLTLVKVTNSLIRASDSPLVSIVVVHVHNGSSSDFRVMEFHEDLYLDQSFSPCQCLGNITWQLNLSSLVSDLWNPREKHIWDETVSFFIWTKLTLSSSVNSRIDKLMALSFLRVLLL